MSEKSTRRYTVCVGEQHGSPLACFVTVITTSKQRARVLAKEYIAARDYCVEYDESWTPDLNEPEGVLGIEVLIDHTCLDKLRCASSSSRFLPGTLHPRHTQPRSARAIVAMLLVRARQARRKLLQARGTSKESDSFEAWLSAQNAVHAAYRILHGQNESTHAYDII